MVDVDADSHGSGPEARARVRVRCLVWCMENIGLWFELGSDSVVRVMARLSFRIIVMHG